MSQQRLGPQAPGWAAQENGKEMLLWPEEWGSIFCNSVQSPTYLPHSKTFRNPFEPFQIKWEVYFSKELCPLVFIVLNMFLHASAYEYVTALQQRVTEQETLSAINWLGDPRKSSRNWAFRRVKRLDVIPKLMNSFVNSVNNDFFKIPITQK